MKDRQLWNNIERFKLDKDQVKFTFTKRLARDNNWPLSFAQLVVEEYEKFMYLCAISEKQITPSDFVDQAWHLHLTYTQSYWVEFCENTIGKLIHHHPTEGGNEERMRFEECYDRLFALYEEEFGEHPPKAAWNDKGVRFNKLNFKRVDLNKYFLLPKPKKWFTKLFLIPLFTIIILIIVISFPWILPVVLILIILFGYRKGIYRKTKYSGDQNFLDSFDVDSDSGCSGCSGCGD